MKWLRASLRYARLYDCGMDALTSLLDHVRSSGALLGRNILTPPWTIRFADAASLTLVTMLRGQAWIVPHNSRRTDGRDPIELTMGDLALVLGPAPFTVTNDPDGNTPPLYVLQDTSTCTDDRGRVLDEEELKLGVRTCGVRLDGDHALLTGTYRASGAVADRVLSALPKTLIVPQADQSTPLALIEAEIIKDQPGQQAVLDRLLDLLLIATLRDWFSRSDTAAPGWYTAMADPIVGPSLRAIHADPARPWTVAALAHEANVSRATFARRFTELVGESPIAHLTGWRLCLAADLLRDSDSTVDSIAREVGYSTAYALSTAFARQFGVRPSEHRSASFLGATSTA